VGLLGLGLLLWGIAQIHRPAALIVAGLLGIGWAIRMTSLLGERG
jgi:hypothetical protein